MHPAESVEPESARLPFVGKTGLLSEAVRKTLEERILGGEWVTGNRIPSEPELAQQLGVSRSVVRDAVRTLAARGLLEVRQGFGTTVRPPADDSYRDAITVMLARSDLTVGDLARAREALDVRLAELAAVNREPADLASLQRHHDAFLAASREGGWSEVEAAHLHFHLAILEAARLPALVILLRPLQRVILATGRPLSLDDPKSWRVDLETAVLTGIRSGDPKRARAAMEEHYWFVRDPSYGQLHARPLSDALRAV
jgi:DNA-binding FadR family transcriptional regulator